MKPRFMLAVAAAALLSACGGDNSGSGSEEQSQAAGPSQDEYVERVNDLCERFNRRADRKVAPAIAEAVARGQSPDEAAALALQPFLPQMERFLQRASAVPRPEEDEADLERYWTQLQLAPPLMRQLATSLRKGADQAAGPIGDKFLQISAATLPFAQDYGLTACLPGAPR